MPIHALPVPAGYEHSTPYLTCRKAAAAIEFYKAAFGASELYRIPMPGDKIGHAEIRIANAIIMLSDEADCGGSSPSKLGGSPVGIMIYVPDVDAFADRAAKAGATVQEAPTDHFYGDRACRLVDPEGHRWMFATHIEDVSPEEVGRRVQKLFGGG